MLSHVLDLHLQDRTVMKEEFEKKITELHLLLKEAVKVANAAKQVADAANSGVLAIGKKL